MSSLAKNPPQAAGATGTPVTDPSALSPNANGGARLCFWAALDVVYAGLVALVTIRFIPWKVPLANAALLLYATAIAAGAWPLWQGRRLGIRLGIVTSLAGLFAAVVVVTGLVGSWAYLRAIHGVFGEGASVVALFLAACAFQVLGLYPALRLRALLSRGFSSASAGVSKLRAHTTKALVLLALALPLITVLFAHLRFSLHPEEPLSRAAAQAALAHVRARVSVPPRGTANEAADDSLHPALWGVPLGPGPIHIQLFVDGHSIARVNSGRWQKAEQESSSLAEAVAEAANKLAALPAARAHIARGRLKLDRVVAEGPVAGTPNFLLAVSLDPGRDGLRLGNDESVPVLLPDDMLIRDAYGAAPLLPFLDEVRLGIDADWLRAELGNPSDPDWRRFRTESWIECTEGVCPVERGRVIRASNPDPAQAARSAYEFIVRMQASDGRFAYQYLPYADAVPDGAYNLPRHAGTAYSLAMWASATGEPGAGAAADRALSWMAALVEPSCGPDLSSRCVLEPGSRRSTVGVNALFLIALCERLAHVPDRAQETLARGLAEHLLSMQKTNGDFFHVYLPDEGRVDREARPHMFASEEAALALVKAGHVLKDERLLAGAERALDYLTGSAAGQKYGHFLGQFTFGVDSWTCMAAEAGYDARWPGLRKRTYLDFCLGYADFLRRLQFAPGEAAVDFDGHYGFSALMVPQAPAAAGFAEALGAVAGLARRHGLDARPLEGKLRLALDALVRDQLDDDNAYLVPNPARARGGIRRSLVQSEIRIDFVQHALAALLRGTGG